MSAVSVICATVLSASTRRFRSLKSKKPRPSSSNAPSGTPTPTPITVFFFNERDDAEDADAMSDMSVGDEEAVAARTVDVRGPDDVDPLSDDSLLDDDL